MPKIGLSLSLSQKRGTDWNSRLTVSPDNPYPLAPTNLVIEGLVNEENYQEANKEFGDFCKNRMLEGISTLDPGDIGMTGFGLGRDAGWIETAIERGFRVTVWDKSRVACRNTTRMFRKKHFKERLQVERMEVLKGWKSGKIREDGMVAYYCSQFLEHQGDALGKFAFNFGRFLSTSSKRRNSV